MIASVRASTVERARPLLGTVVAIRATAASAASAHRAIDAAFADVSLVHRLMSFHDTHSDLGRLNREAARGAVQVHAHTWRVLRWARTIAQLSAGCFDIGVARRLVTWGELPAPSDSWPDECADWRDIELLPQQQVRFRRALWIDLGGIAKGYAVDLALVRLRWHGVRCGAVNAGGDLRQVGPEAQIVALRVVGAADCVPLLEISNSAVATSSSGGPPYSDATVWATAARRIHVGRHGDAADPGVTAAVLAPRCVVADALTKVVLADPIAATRALSAFGARAYRYHAQTGWQTWGT